MIRLKICGLRDADNAVKAAEAGADFLGFIFVPGARRRVSVDRARAIVEEYRCRHGSGGPRLVGLFADQPADEVDRTARRVGLDLAQLCGDEGPDYWRELSVPIIKQIKVRDQRERDQAVAETLRRVKEVVGHGHLASLDKYHRGAKGGTGRAFDWTIAADVAGRHDFLLAGGLTPENVAEAIATVGPWGVDVSSGVETEGVKDARKIASFADEVRWADARIGEPSSAPQ
jgi:phosphoribosylanthranilate isomerase